MEELINIFSLERVGKSGAKFDFDKTKWFNQQYLRAKTKEDLAQDLQIILKEKGKSLEEESERILEEEENRRFKEEDERRLIEKNRRLNEEERKIRKEKK